MEWTRDLPKEDGHYWFMECDRFGRSDKVTPSICKIEKGVMWVVASDKYHELKNLGMLFYWCKIDAPEFSNKCPNMHSSHGHYKNTCSWKELNNFEVFHCPYPCDKEYMSCQDFQDSEEYNEGFASAYEVWSSQNDFT